MCSDNGGFALIGYNEFKAGLSEECVILSEIIVNHHVIIWRTESTSLNNRNIRPNKSEFSVEFMLLPNMLCCSPLSFSPQNMLAISTGLITKTL